MTICTITGYACQCQPDDGVPCVGVADLRAALSEWRQKATDLGAQLAQARALIAIGRDYIASEVQQNAQNLGDRLRHRQQPARDDLAAFDAFLSQQPQGEAVITEHYMTQSELKQRGGGGG